jgi:hypothetical protein
MMIIKERITLPIWFLAMALYSIYSPVKAVNMNIRCCDGKKPLGQNKAL